MGLLSIVDALLDKPIEEVLRSIPVAEEVKTALCGGTNRFRDVLELLVALERAEWPQVSNLAQQIGCSEDSVPDAYHLAIQSASAVGA